MNRQSEVRSTRVHLKLALLLLSMAVFMWGLYAKLALYNRPSPARTASIAKIIEGKKKTDTIEVSAAALPSNLPTPLIRLSVPLIQHVPAFLFKGDNHLVACLLNRSIPIYPSALLFRPPPIAVQL